MWESLRYSLSDAKENFIDFVGKFWRALSNKSLNTILLLIPSVFSTIAAYYSLDASRKSNETSEHSLGISQQSQRLAERVALRERMGNRAEILATVEEERCWQVGANPVCQMFFTLTNAGRYTAEALVVSYKTDGTFSPLETMDLTGDLPGGQKMTFATKMYAYEKRLGTYEHLALATAYRDKELRVCATKSWVFQPVVQNAADGTTKFVGSIGASFEQSQAESLAKSDLKDCEGEAKP